MPSSVRLDSVGYQFDGQPMLFEGIDAMLSAGQLWALVGPSGSGKSTLLSLIAGWATPTHGEIQKDNVRRVSWVFQNPYGEPMRTAVDHVSFPIGMRGASRLEATRAARALLEDFGLGGVADRSFSDLSGGEAQRLMLARALAGEPDVLLVDEPTAQLDRASARGVNDVLRGLASGGAIVVVATHDGETVEACDHLLMLDSNVTHGSRFRPVGEGAQ
jgi:ABC-type multidrug transport system ATPase subunit